MRVRWRDQARVKQALTDVMIVPPEALDEAMWRAVIAGASFEEVAQAAGKSKSTVYHHVKRYAESVTA